MLKQVVYWPVATSGLSRVKLFSAEFGDADERDTSFVA
jgi:hypothetical protein